MVGRRTTVKDIEQALLDAARKSGLTIAELARQAELPYSAVHGFVKSGRLITLRSAAAIARALGLELKRKGK
jgi:plasmid maintenance system antidote protein VapI